MPADEMPDGVDLSADIDGFVGLAVAAGVGATAFGLLAAVDPLVLGEQARAQALAALTGVTASVDAIRNAYTAAVAGPAPTSLNRKEADHFGAHDVGVATRMSVSAAHQVIAVARDLMSVLQASYDAMLRGELTLPQAKALHNATRSLPTDIARAVEARVLPRAHLQSASNFSKSVQRAVAALDPDFTSRAKTARAEVEVSHTCLGDGTGLLTIRGPLELTTGIHMAMTAHAAKTKDSLGGTVAQRKLAGLRDWAEAAIAVTDTPRQHGRPPTVNITIDLLTLLGLRNHPAQVLGVGPIPADAVRWLLADGAPFRRLITDSETGHLLDYGAHVYKGPPDMADYLIAKNVTSATPHSGVDARLCDMEHNQPYDHGGPTDRVNTTPVDRRWHRAKTHGDWTYAQLDSGTVRWTSATGLTCDIEPYDYRPDR